MNRVVINSGNGMLSVQHQVITWPNVGLLLNRPFGTFISEIGMKVQQFQENLICYVLSGKMLAILSPPWLLR